jgi:cobalt/nickel transport system permease protein
VSAHTNTDNRSDGASRNRLSRTAWMVVALAVTALVVVAAAIWASEDPDGLERVAEDLGFIDAGAEPGYEILPDYTLPGMEGVASTVVAALIGVVIVLVLMVVLGRLLARRRA